MANQIHAANNNQSPPSKRRRAKRNLRWNSLTGPFEAGDYLVVPLTSSDELREEGEIMNHCVGQRYHRWCHDGAVRVFSIRTLLGERVATASIYFDFFDRRWRLEQCKGYGNREVCRCSFSVHESESGDEPSELHFLVQHLVALYQQAQEKLDGSRGINDNETGQVAD